MNPDATAPKPQPARCVVTVAGLEIPLVLPRGRELFGAMQRSRKLFEPTDPEQALLSAAFWIGHLCELDVPPWGRREAFGDDWSALASAVADHLLDELGATVVEVFRAGGEAQDLCGRKLGVSVEEVQETEDFSGARADAGS